MKHNHTRSRARRSVLHCQISVNLRIHLNFVFTNFSSRNSTVTALVVTFQSQAKEQIMCRNVSSSSTARPSCQRVLLFAVSLLIFFIECRCSAVPASSVMIHVGSNRLQPIEVLKRLPGAVVDSTKASISSFIQTAGVVIPAGLIWKIGTLRSSGMKSWAMEGGK